MRRDEFLKQVDLYSKYLNTVLQKTNRGEMDFNIAYNQLNALTLVRYGLLTNPKISISLGNPEEEEITQYKYIPTNFFTNGLYENQKEAVIKALNMENIFPELATGSILMCMTGIGNTHSDYEKLLSALEKIAIKAFEAGEANFDSAGNSDKNDAPQEGGALSAVYPDCAPAI